MRRSLFLFAIALLATPSLCRGGEAKHSGVIPARLRCEYRANPLAVDGTHPRLSWIVESRTPGQRQSAFRVIVASSPEKLSKTDGDLWDSGKVATDETLHHAYAGRPLASGQAAFWKVMVWDKDNRPSGWSKPASWSVGLRQPSDWTAKWIAAPGTATASDTPTLDGASWVWWAGDPATAPQGTRWFRLKVEVPADIVPTKAVLAISADDSYRFRVNGGAEIVGPRVADSWRTYQRYKLDGLLKAGNNIVEVAAENAGPSPAGAIASLVATTTRAKIVRVTGPETEAAERPEGPWTAARVIGPLGTGPWGMLSPAGAEAGGSPPATYFRKSFAVEKPVARAILYATALGVYELSLNGKRVGDDVLSPGWTDYRKRVHYLAYDVTKQLSEGENALGAILGDGWYASYLGFTGRRKFYGGDPKLRLQLNIAYADGTKATIGTDESWQSAAGPILSADMLMGATIDTRREPVGWKAAAVAEPPAIPVEAHPGEPIRVTARIAARSRAEPKKGVFVYDIGQNLSGWVRLTVNGKPGQRVTLRHAERLNPDGTLYTTNLRAAKATDTFVLKGGRQTLEPTFTFHGFQYVEVTGLETAPAARDVVAVAVHSDLRRTLTFDSDNPLLNQLVANTDWGQRGNYLDVPTDCPQRDERLGWTGDAQVFAKTAMFNRDSAPFFTKWLVDLIDDGQFPDGSLPDVAPSIIGGGNAAWEDAGVVCTYRIFEMFGDTRAIEDHWSGLTRYMEHLARVSPGGIRPPGSYGDWLLLDGPQRSAIHGTAYYFFCATLMARMADAIGRPEEAQRYRLTADIVRAAFNARFVGDDGRVMDEEKESQTFYALALAWGMLPEAKRAPAAGHLERLIAARDYHLATGFIGTPVLLPALASAGKADLANRLLLADTYPSWLYQIKLGATSMWERWDGWTPERGFQDPGMNSFNHYWLGCVGEWIVTGLAGIDTDGPGWKKIRLAPHWQGALQRVRVVYDSVRGPIESAWAKNADGSVALSLTIPANTTATLSLPAGWQVDGRQTLALEAGSHHFTVTPG